MSPLGRPGARAGAAAIACTFAVGFAPPAGAETLGIRPIGADYTSARTVGIGKWAIEGGLWAPSFTAPSDNTQADTQVLQHWQTLPMWPAIRGLYGLQDGNEAEAFIGPVVGGAWRKLFLRAEAPWPDEYLQAMIEVGGGLQMSYFKSDWLPFPVPAPMGYIRFPAIFEAGAFTLHIAGGGYYLFNNQPIVDADAGIELTPFDHLQVGVLAKLRMDSTKITPFDGIWSFGGGARYQIGPRFVVQLDLNQDAGPPSFPTSKPSPRIEFAYQSLRLTSGYYF